MYIIDTDILIDIQRGHQPAVNCDSLIAACAITVSADLGTFNVKHYRTIPGFRTVQPYAR